MRFTEVAMACGISCRGIFRPRGAMFSGVTYVRAGGPFGSVRG